MTQRPKAEQTRLTKKVNEMIPMIFCYTRRIGAETNCHQNDFFQQLITFHVFRPPCGGNRMTTDWVNIQEHFHIPTMINRTLLIFLGVHYESTRVPGIKLLFTLIIKGEFDE